MIPLIAAGVGLLGSAMGASAAKDAAATSAAAQIEAAKIAAEQAKFRPVGITTRFGQSTFGFDPKTGYLNAAGYTISPELKAIQDQIMSQAGAYDTANIGNIANANLMPGAQGLFNLGQQYLAQSPEEAAQKYMTSQQALLAPSREQQLANVRNQVYQTGRQGLAVGGTEAGGRQQASPEMAAYYNALAQQDASLAAQAEQAGQQRATFGAGLLSSGAGMLGQIPSLTTQGYGPLQTQLGLASTMEQLGQSPLDIGAQLGGRTATAGATAANALLTGGMGAAQTGLQGTLAGQGILSNTMSGIMNNLSKQTGGGGNLFGDMSAWWNSNVGRDAIQPDTGFGADTASSFYGSSYNPSAGWSA